MIPTHPRRWGVSIALIIFLVGGGLLGHQWVKLLEHEGERGYAALEKGAQALKVRDTVAAKQAFQEAEHAFRRGTTFLFGMQYLLPALQYIPGLGRGVSGIALMEAGGHFTRGAQSFTALIDQALRELESKSTNPSLLDLLTGSEAALTEGKQELQAALISLRYVRPESLPEDKQAPFQRGERLLPVLTEGLNLSLEHFDILTELLGGNGPRLYLFLFQNNHELRPTGGFIGSYALLDIYQGHIRRFFVDGIFNPDGQLKENIVPPAPIQKISAGWSLHDSNWFPDFPTSAEKARFFYEKTGGPTTDGVIALTPEVLERVLKIIGPIDLPEYGITVDAENFLPLLQEEVELHYDKEENNPKKILGDLTGVILERLTKKPDPILLWQLADSIVGLLNERHILLFARDTQAQSLIQASGWSGAMLSTPYDYLSVIHTNINGFKTDGVIKDSIEHTVSVQPDGTLLDTVKVTRTHTGGNTPHEWWNKVNANYMRVYVPLGSELLSAEGMTREFPTPPLDYEALAFRRDAEVVEEELKIRIDEASGTRIGEEFGKTVFGNWVYVSPGESVTVTYRYRLPFRLAVTDTDQTVPFSILYQKQAGTKQVKLHSNIAYPEGLTPIWQSSENLVPYGRTLTLDTSLDSNTFLGAVFQSIKK